MTSEQASVLIAYIEALQDRANHEGVMREMQACDLNDLDVDDALRELGDIAGRKCRPFL